MHHIESKDINKIKIVYIMETKERELPEFKHVTRIVNSLAEKFGCTRQYVRNVLMGGEPKESIKAMKIREDARAIEEIIERETKITV